MAHTGRLLVELRLLRSDHMPNTISPTNIHPPKRGGAWRSFGCWCRLGRAASELVCFLLLLFRNFCARLDDWSFAHSLHIHSYDCRSWQF